MDESRCSKCQKIIYLTPCPYCGSEESYLEVSISDKIGISDLVDAVVIKGSSAVTIEKDDKIVSQKSYINVSSGHIADDSLSEFNLKDITPSYIRDQIVYNIDKIEQYSNENPPDKVTHEHSFELNLKIFKYKYKRIIEKPKKN